MQADVFVSHDDSHSRRGAICGDGNFPISCPRNKGQMLSASTHLKYLELTGSQRLEQRLARAGGRGVAVSWVHRLCVESWERFGNWPPWGRLHNVLNAMKATVVVHSEMVQMVPGIWQRFFFFVPVKTTSGHGGECNPSS